MEGDVIITQDIFVFEMLGEDAKGNILGRHMSTGIGRPRFWDRARYYGEEKRLAAALDAAEVAKEPVSVMFRLSDTNRFACSFWSPSPWAAWPGSSCTRSCPARRNVERRMASVARSRPGGAHTGSGKEKSRREQVEETLKELEAQRRKIKRPPLQTRITQAGLSMYQAQLPAGERRRGGIGVFMLLAMIGARTVASAGARICRRAPACRYG